MREALKNAEAKKAKRAAKVAREATIPCRACGKVQAECFCNGWHSSAKDRGEPRGARQPREPRQRLTPEQAERLKHLRVLGLTLAQDTEVDIKKAYRALALLNHPDKQGDAEIMKAINASHDFLVGA
jgi:CDGSH-type Zn-finger protein